MMQDMDGAEGMQDAGQTGAGESQTMDRRIMVAEIDLGDRQVRVEGLEMRISVTKTSKSTPNEAEIKIANLARAERDFLITATSPLVKHTQRKCITIYAGTRDTGLYQVFFGDITSAQPTQGPDIWLTIKAKTGAFSRTTLVARSADGKQQLSAIAGDIAKDLGAELDFQASDKLIDNYSFTGGAGLQVNKLEQSGVVEAYLDDNKLVVRDATRPLKNRNRALTKDSGLIGMPEVTDKGVKAKMLFDGEVGVGVQIAIDSELNPAATGAFTIHTAKYDLSTFDNAWYIEFEATPDGARKKVL